MKKLLFICSFFIASPAFAWSTYSEFQQLFNSNPTSADHSVTISTSSTQVVPATTASNLLYIQNQSANNVACNFSGGTAVIGGAGSTDIQSKGWISFTDKQVPLNAINCIASASSTALTVIYH